MAERESGDFVVSFSEVKTFHECGHRHLKLYREGLNQLEEFNQTGIYNGWGSAFHDTLDAFFREKISIDESESFFKEQMWKQLGKILKGPALKSEEIDIFLDCYENSFQAIKFLPTWLKQEFGNYKILGTEVKYEIPVSALVEILPIESRAKNKLAYENTYLKGFIDCMLLDEFGNIRILDWKTSYNGWNSYKRKDKELHHQVVLYKAVILAGMKISGEKEFNFQSDSDRAPLKIHASKILPSFVITKPLEEKKKPFELFSVPSGADSIISSVKWLCDAIISMRKNINFHNTNSCRFCPLSQHPEHCKNAIDL